MTGVGILIAFLTVLCFFGFLALILLLQEKWENRKSKMKQ